MKYYLHVHAGSRWYDKRYVGGPHEVTDPLVVAQIEADLAEGVEGVELIESHEEIKPAPPAPNTAVPGPLTAEDLHKGTEEARKEQPVPPVEVKEQPTPQDPVEFPCPHCEKKPYKSEAARDAHVAKHHPAPAEVTT